MENSLYLGLSKQMVLRSNMDMIANNIANMNTSGYRSQNMMFEEFISDPDGTDDPLSFVMNRGQYQTTEPGSLKYTGNPLNFGLVGPGYFGVQAPNGEVMYSRSGDLQIDAAGTLQTASGYPVADAGGATINIPAGSTEIKIDERGMVSNQDGAVGQIMMAEFANQHAMKPFGYNLYETEQEAQEAVNTRMKQGQLEGSNVKPVIEMTRMIDTLRNYQSIQNILQKENDRLRNAIQKLTGQ